MVGGDAVGERTQDADNKSRRCASTVFLLPCVGEDPELSGGSKRTMEFAKKLGKPCRYFRPGVDVKFLRRFLEMHKVKTLNVAGPRAFNVPGITEYVTECLDKVPLGK